MPVFFYDLVFTVFAFLLGAVVGSFLNVVIYRLPRGLSVNEPKRSFCPHCEKQIPWHLNLPLVSWLSLRGKCAFCKGAIPFRYFVVELTTALLFGAVWLKFAPLWTVALALMVLMALMIAATFIDVEHLIIPNELTWGGVAAGVVLSLLVPQLHQTESFWQAGLWALVGAASGYFLLWAVVEAGKLAFGVTRISSETPEAFTLHDLPEEVELRMGEETLKWSDTFSRVKDRLRIQASNILRNDVALPDQTLVCYYNRICFLDENRVEQEVPYDQLGSFSANTTEMLIPREAMGFGDVKFIAAIGAFLGWQAVLFTVAAGSIVGAALGLAVMLVRRGESTKLPFGPYLALGAFIWIFYGPELIDWYWSLLDASIQPGQYPW